MEVCDLWKDFYFDVFRERSPTKDECSAFFESTLGIECNVSLACLEMNFPTQETVDQNEFNALGFYFSCGERRDIAMCKLRGVARCVRCHILRAMWTFIVSDDDSFSANCNNCRGDTNVLVSESRITYIIDVDLLENGLCGINKIMDIHFENYSAARRMERPLEGVIFGSGLVHVLTEGEEGGETSKAVANFMTHLQKIECYRYIRSGGNSGTAKRFYCCQRMRAVKEPTESAFNPLPTERLRVRQSKKQYLCGGIVSFSFGCSKMRVKVRHEAHHGGPASSRTLSKETVQRIQALTQSGMSPFQILNTIRAEGVEVALYNDVYNVWLKSFSSRYKKHADPIQSSLLYMEASGELEQICVLEEPFAMGCVTKIGEHIVTNWRVEEVFIDSTFKTNKNKLELFALIASCMGVGFPIAYFLLEAGTGNGLRNREESLTLFLTNVASRFPDLKPTFFFTDKEQAQISAIKNAFSLCPSLCLWHVKRAIMRKIADAVKKGESNLAVPDQNRVLEMIDLHYFRSSVFMSQTQEELYSVACGELISLFSTTTEYEILRYLRHNWYDEDSWSLWGRRNTKKVAISRTTMKVESHWSVLKRLYLLPFNRPRVDLLIHIIDVTLMRKFWCDYKSLMAGEKKPFWWKMFVKSWKKCAATAINNNYYTCLESHFCSCKSWQRSQYFFCKHLIASKPCPTYRQVRLNRSPPFLIIDINPDRVRANIDDEEVTSEMGAEKEGTACVTANADEDEVTTEVGGPANESTSSPLMAVSAITTTPDSTGPSIYHAVDKVLKCSAWFNSHVIDLSTHAAGHRQLEYIETHILPRLETYKTNVERSTNGRKTPRTWERNDTIYLP